MSKAFRRPFGIYPPLDPDHFSKCGDVSIPERERRQATESWTVEDADGMVISSHKTEESAKAALEAAERNMP